MYGIGWNGLASLVSWPPLYRAVPSTNWMHSVCDDYSYDYSYDNYCIQLLHVMYAKAKVNIVKRKRVSNDMFVFQTALEQPNPGLS